MSSLARLLIYQARVNNSPSCFLDMVPGGKLEHGAECDKGVNISNTEGGGLAEDVQNRETSGEERTRGQRRTANWSEPKTRDSAVELVENAYTEAVYLIKMELARDQFIQGLGIRDDFRGRVFMSQPESLVEACVFHRLESAHKSCQAVASLERKKSANVVRASAETETISYEIQEHKELELFFTVYNEEK